MSKYKYKAARFIAGCSGASSQFICRWRVKYDLSSIGGPSGMVREYEKTWPLGSDQEAVAAEVDGYMSEMVDRGDTIAAKYGFRIVTEGT